MSPFFVLSVMMCAWRAQRRQRRASVLAFFALVATLVPLGIGADLRLLARVAAGVLWVAAVLAALLSLDRLFQGDYDDGSLEVIALAPLPLELASLAKILAHYLSTGLPLTLLSPLLALMFHLPWAGIEELFMSLLDVGTPAVSAIVRHWRRVWTCPIPQTGWADPAPDYLAAAGSRGDFRLATGYRGAGSLA